MSLSDVECESLLRGEVQDSVGDVLVTPHSDRRCVERVVGAMDINSHGSTLYLLQLPSFDPDAFDRGFVDLKSFASSYEEASIGRGAASCYLPCLSRSPSVFRTAVRYSKWRDDERQQFMVFKIQRILKSKCSSESFAVQWVRQKKEWIELYLVDCPVVDHGTVVCLSGVECQLDGCHLAKKAKHPNVIALPVHYAIFPPSNTNLVNAFATFVGQLETDRVLYEIRPAVTTDWETYMPPCQRDWDESDMDSVSSEDEWWLKGDCSDRRRASLQVQRGAPLESSAHEELLVQPVSGVKEDDNANVAPPPEAPLDLQQSSISETDQVATLNSHACGQISSDDASESLSELSNISTVPPLLQHNDVINEGRMQNFYEEAKHDPRKYFLNYFLDDREMFKLQVVQPIMRHEAFKTFLHELFTRCGSRAFVQAFDLVSSHKIGASHSELNESVSTQLYWDMPIQSGERAINRHEQALIQEGMIPTIALRRYQLETVEMIMTSGNFLVQAATGSGKTRIFVEVARRTLMNDPKSRIFVVVPKKALTSQHKTEFDEHHFTRCGLPAGAFCGSTASSVTTILSHSVVVITADKLDGHLKNSEISFAHINVLIMDEAHHARGDSGYRRIMDKYHYLSDAERRETKVVGFSATTAQANKKECSVTSLHNLLDVLHVPSGNLIHIQDNNHEIVQNIPQARPEKLEVEERPADVNFREFLCDFVGDLVTKNIPKYLRSLDLSHLNAIRIPTHFALLDDSNPNGGFQQWRYDTVSQLKETDVDDFHKTDIEKAASAVCLLDEAARQSRDVGFESSLMQLLNKLREMHIEMKDIIAACEHHSGVSLFEDLYYGIQGSPYMQMLPPSMLISGKAAPPECGCFPKFQKLIEVLAAYKDAPSFHAMVFVRTRAAVEQLCKMLQESYLSDSMDFKLAIGQGKKSKDKETGQSSCVEEGMTLAALNAVLSWFKEDGKKVLVTTSVSDEGINVVQCELVVRYSSALSGTEYTQSRGRARKEGARFVTILEKNSVDARYLKRCMKEEEDSKRTIMNCKAAIHI